MRLKSIDILKLFAMFLVIWGHCVQFLLTSHYFDEPVFVYIHSFHLPLFFMISGLFVQSKEWRDGGRYILVKARQLLLPCITWGLLMSAGNLLQPILTGTEANIPLWRTILTNFWFLKSLFVCFLLWIVSHLLFRKRWLAILISLIASLFITEWGVQWMYPSFVVGACIGGYMDDFRRHSIPIAVTAILSGVLLLFWWDASCFRIPSIYALLSGSVENIPHALFMRIYRLLVHISLSAGLIALFLRLEDHVSTNGFLTSAAKWGRLTLGIYIIHSLMFIVRDRLFPSFLCCNSLNPWLFNIAIAPLLAAVLLSVSAVITSILSRFPYLSFFLLGTSWPRRQ